MIWFVFPKVFCISLQRTGTTSTGQFLKDHGYRCIGWGGDRDNKWSQSWLEGKYESIFSSLDFRLANAYEDSPWWMPKFYETLAQRFPDSKFILLDRDSEKWFKSMQTHSHGNIPGSLRVHCKAYKRDTELQSLIQTGSLSDGDLDRVDWNKPLKIEDKHKDHYIRCYENHSAAAKDYFSKQKENRFFYGKLEDPKVWKNMAAFFGFEVDDCYQAVKNVTANTTRRQ